MLKKTSFIFIFLLVHQLGITQIIQVSPAFPTVNDVVTIHYNASQGNGGSVGVTQDYTHTGIVTRSGLPSSWSYVQGNWGQADTNVLMTYSDGLTYFGKWYLQRWAESIGKKDRGITALHAIGTTDQHSQLQLYLDGPKDKFFTFIKSYNVASYFNVNTYHNKRYVYNQNNLFIKP